MRFLMLLMVNATSDAGVLSAPERIDALNRYNESMVKAGVLLDAACLQPAGHGVRRTLRGSRPTVVDTPIAHPPELVAGFWVIQVKSPAEAIEWARRCPSLHAEDDAQIELRQVCELPDVTVGSSPLDLHPNPVQTPDEAGRR